MEKGSLESFKTVVGFHIKKLFSGVIWETLNSEKVHNDLPNMFCTFVWFETSTADVQCTSYIYDYPF